MARNPKHSAVQEITEEFSSSSAAVLTEYRGLSVAQLKELRRSLAGNATYAVVKNTLTKIAAEDAGIDGLEHLLVGPTAIAFVKGDPVEAAKGLRDFARAHPRLVIKGGYLDGNVLTAEEMTKYADLESREVLLAKLAGAMNASLQQAVALFAAPLSQAARTIEALRVAAEANPALIGGAGQAPVAEQASTADAVETDTPTEAEAPVAEAEASAEATPAEAPADAATDAAAAAEENAEG